MTVNRTVASLHITFQTSGINSPDAFKICCHLQIQTDTYSDDTRLCLLTSSAFIKSMIHIELMKKQKFPKWYYVEGRGGLGGSESSHRGCCRYNSTVLSIAVRLTLTFSSFDRNQDTRDIQITEA